MGRIRTVKPEFNSHEDLSSLSCAAHLLAEALLCYADDDGYFNANPGLVRAGTCPLRKDFEDISGLLTELSGIGYVRFGKTQDGRRYGHIVHFLAHQKISHPTGSKIKNLPIKWEESATYLESSGEIPEDSVKATDILRPEQGTGNREQGTGDREGEARKRATPPPEEERPAPPTRNLPASPGGTGEFAAAFWLQQEIGLACSAGDMQVLAQVVMFVARDLSFPGSMEAAEWLKRSAESATGRGEAVNLFWFKDGKYKQTGGGQNGTNQPSAAKQRINGARIKLAEIAVRRGLVDLAGGDGRAGETVPVAGSGGIDRGISGGPGSAGGEVFSAPSCSGSP